MRTRCIALAAAGLALAACGTPAPAEPAPATPSPSVRPTDPVPTPQAGPATVRGLDVRYVDDQGELKVLRVEDFPR